jgi:hypothetical protein
MQKTIIENLKFLVAGSMGPLAAEAKHKFVRCFVEINVLIGNNTLIPRYARNC